MEQISASECNDERPKIKQQHCCFLTNQPRGCISSDANVIVADSWQHDHKNSNYVSVMASRQPDSSLQSHEQLVGSLRDRLRILSAKRSSLELVLAPSDKEMSLLCSWRCTKLTLTLRWISGKAGWTWCNRQLRNYFLKKILLPASVLSSCQYGRAKKQIVLFF